MPGSWRRGQGGSQKDHHETGLHYDHREASLPPLHSPWAIPPDFWKMWQKSSNPTCLCDSFPGRVGFPHYAAEEGSGDPDLLGPSLTPYLVFASALPLGIGGLLLGCGGWADGLSPESGGQAVPLWSGLSSDTSSSFECDSL